MRYGVHNAMWYGLLCLLGEQDTDWEFYETDPEWWQCFLYLKRN